MRRSGIAVAVLLTVILAGAVGLSLTTAFAVSGGTVPRPTPTSIVEPRAAMSSQGYANLVVESIEVLPRVPLVGQDVTIKVTIANLGDDWPDGNFYVDVFVDPPIARSEDLLWMPGFAEEDVNWLQRGVQAAWLPPGSTCTVSFTYCFQDSGMTDLYAVVDIRELGLPYGNVNEGGAENEDDNVFGPHSVEVRYPDVIVAKDNSDFVRGPASSLAIVPVATPSTGADESGESLGALALTFGDSGLTLGYFEERPYKWGLTDPETPDYNMQSLDTRLNDDDTLRPQIFSDLLMMGSWWQCGKTGATAL